MLALLCSGQGTQHAEMFRLTGAEPAAAVLFAAAQAALDGEDPRAFVQSASDAALQANAAAQVLCCTQALAAHVCLAPMLPRRIVFAGYSVGEWAAWGCAGLLDPLRVPALVRRRAMLMDAASGPDGTLAAIRGLPRAAVETLCGRYNAAVAIINPGALTIVGGRASDLAMLCHDALTDGASRAGLLPVATPSHTPFLTAAVAPLRVELEAAWAGRRLSPGVRLVAGHDGGLVRGIPGDLDALARQAAARLDWAAALQACAELGVDNVLELGPGHALADMARDVIPGVAARSLEDFSTMAGAADWAAAADR